MKNLILFLISCSSIANLAALEWDSPVNLPAREVLKDRLCAAGFEYFEEKTKLSERLTGYEAAQLALYNFKQCLSNPRMARLREMCKPLEEKTKLSERLTGYEAAQLALYNFKQDLSNPRMARLRELRKS